MEIHRLKKYFVISGGILSSLGLARKQYRKAVDDVTLTFRRGKVLVLVGESGSGKTTLARLMLRAVEPDSGSIIFDGHDITNKSEKELKYFRKK